MIATPTAFHADAARALLELGKPILVEKPVTPDLATRRALVACAERRGVPLLCGSFEMPPLTFQIANWASAFLWGGVILGIGVGGGRLFG